MHFRRLITVSALAAFGPALMCGQIPIASADQATAVANRYCATCHNNKLKTGGLTLERLDIRNPAKGGDAVLETWEKAIRKVRVGMMPPQGALKPTEQERATLVTWLESELDRAEAADPHPGSVGVHRMNRAEYANAIRDLLDLRIDAASLLPLDDSAFGFDNIAETLGASPALVEQYLSAAGKIASLAVGDPDTGPAAEVVRIRQDESQNLPIDGMPVGTEGGTVIHTTLPLDGEYQLNVKYMISNLGAMKGLEMEHQVEIAVDGKRVLLASIGGYKDFTALMRNITEAQQDVERRSSTRLALTAGPHIITAGFVYQGAEQGSTRLEPYLRSSQDNLDATGHPHIETVTITGPFHPTGVSDTPSRRRIFVCRPKPGASDAEQVACARTILQQLARRAYRGAATGADLDRLMKFFSKGRAQRGFEGGIQTALERLLASPKFTFRVERDPADLAPGKVHALSDLEFAIINQHNDLAALLLEKGADPNVPDKTGMTAVYAAVDMNGFRGEIGRPLRTLPDRLQTLDVLRMALKHNGDPNARLRKPILGRHHGFGDGALGEGSTPLMRAARSNDIEAMKVLLDSGADAHLAMANGSNVLTLLAGIRPASGPNSGDRIVASLRLLTGRGANPNAKTTRGDTPLLIAARLGSNEVVRALVELGADLNATDNTGKTALDTVQEPGRNRHEDTEALLRELAAHPASR